MGSRGGTDPLPCASGLGLQYRSDLAQAKVAKQHCKKTSRQAQCVFRLDCRPHSWCFQQAAEDRAINSLCEPVSQQDQPRLSLLGEALWARAFGWSAEGSSEPGRALPAMLAHLGYACRPDNVQAAAEPVLAGPLEDARPAPPDAVRPPPEDVRAGPLAAGRASASLSSTSDSFCSSYSASSSSEVTASDESAGSTNTCWPPCAGGRCPTCNFHKSSAEVHAGLIRSKALDPSAGGWHRRHLQA